MNVKNIKELCGEAGLSCTSYRVPLSDVRCLAILCPGVSGVTDPVCELVETLLDQPVDGSTYLGYMYSEISEAWDARDEELRTLLALLRGGHSAFTGTGEERTQLIYWPTLAWEE